MYSTPWQPWHIVQGLGLWPKDLATLAKGPRHSAIVFLRYKPYMDARRSNPDQVLMFAGACWHSSPPARAPHPSLHTSGRPRARTRGRGSSAMGASPSSLALGALGALFAAQAGVAAFAPQAFASLLGAPAPSPAMSRMLAACFATFGVLFAVRRPRAARGARGKRADGARHSLRLGVSTSTRWQPSLTVHCSGFCPRVDDIIYCQHGCA